MFNKHNLLYLNKNLVSSSINLSPLSYKIITINDIINRKYTTLNNTDLTDREDSINTTSQLDNILYSKNILFNQIKNIINEKQTKN